MVKDGECHWHIGKIGSFEDKDFCKKQCNFSYVIDDNGKKVRRYNSFCEEHRKMSMRGPDNED